MDVNSRLLPEWHPVVRREGSKAFTIVRSNPDVRATGGRRMAGRSLFRKVDYESRVGVSSNWHIGLDDRLPFFLTLCERSRGLLDKVGMHYPAAEPRTPDLFATISQPRPHGHQHQVSTPEFVC